MSPAAVLLTAAGYAALLFAVAWIAGRKADNAGFFLGNRRTPWYMAALAMIGSAMSGVTFISVPGSVAADAFSYMQMVAGFTVGQLIVAFVLIPVFYRLRVVSLYEYLGRRFGPVSHRTGAWVFFLSKMSSGAMKVYVVCTVMQLLVFDRYGLPFWLNAVATMALVWLYTRQGGVRSLIWTDSLQTLCLVASIAATIVCVMRSLGLSAGEAVREVAASPLSRMIFLDDPASGRYFWKMFVAGIVLLVAMTGLDQDMMQRNMSCPSPRAAQKNVVLTALCQIVVILAFLFLGVLLYRYAEFRGGLFPDGDRLFPAVAVDGGLPAAVGVLFVAGLVSSTWSTAGSALTALTTSFTIDLLDGPRRFGERSLARVRRGVHLLLAACMTGLILAVRYIAGESLINLFFRVAGYTYGPILGFFLFGLLTRRRPRERWVPAAAIAGPAAGFALQWAAARWWEWHIGFELLLYNALVVFAVLWLLSLGRDSVNRLSDK